MNSCPQNILPISRVMRLRDFPIQRQCFSINRINHSIIPDWIPLLQTLEIVTWTHENFWPPQSVEMSLTTYSMKDPFPSLYFELATHSAPLNALISCTETNIEELILLSPGHSRLKVFTCWVLSIIARASAISFWLTPQRFATFVWHLWWTFMPHAERKNKRRQDNKG